MRTPLSVRFGLIGAALNARRTTCRANPGVFSLTGTFREPRLTGPKRAAQRGRTRRGALQAHSVGSTHLRGVACAGLDRRSWLLVLAFGNYALTDSRI